MRKKNVQRQPVKGKSFSLLKATLGNEIVKNVYIQFTDSCEAKNVISRESFANNQVLVVFFCLVAGVLSEISFEYVLPRLKCSLLPNASHREAKTKKL